MKKKIRTASFDFLTIIAFFSFILFSNLNSCAAFDTNRTAIIISGQLRSGNLSFLSDHIRKNQAAKMFGAGDPPTPIETIIEWLFKPILAQGGGIDVFMYVQAHPEQNNVNWDGNPSSYVAAVGDNRACEPFLNHGLFGSNTTNHFFCLVEPELQLMNTFLKELPVWKTYDYGQMLHAREQLLQQMYGIYRANLAARQYAMVAGLAYSYKVRLRPDVAFTRPFPAWSRFDFKPRSSGCDSTLIYPNKKVMTNGAQDSFLVGRANDMEPFFDRYLEFISKPLLLETGMTRWNSETALTASMRVMHKICMDHEVELWTVPIRSANMKLHGWTPQGQSWRPEEIKNQWVDVGK